MSIKEYYFNKYYCDLIRSGIPIQLGMLCKSIYPLKDLNFSRNNIFVISRIEKNVKFYNVYNIFAYRIKINTIFDEPEKKFNSSNLVYCLEDSQLWEHRLNEHLGLTINNRFEILDIR